MRAYGSRVIGDTVWDSSKPGGECGQTTLSGHAVESSVEFRRVRRSSLKGIGHQPLGEYVQRDLSATQGVRGHSDLRGKRAGA